MEIVQKTQDEMALIPDKQREIIYSSLKYNDYINSLIDKYESMDNFDFMIAMQTEKNPFVQNICIEEEYMHEKGLEQEWGDR